MTTPDPAPRVNPRGEPLFESEAAFLADCYATTELTPEIMETFGFRPRPCHCDYDGCRGYILDHSIEAYLAHDHLARLLALRKARPDGEG